MEFVAQKLCKIMALLAAIIGVYFGSIHPVLAQQPASKAYFNGSSDVTVDVVLDLKNSPGTWLSFRTCDDVGELLSQTGSSGDSFTLSINPSGFVEAAWTVGAVSKSVDVGPNYATNTRWVLLKLQYTLGSIVLTVDTGIVSNSTTLASDTVNSELMGLDLSGGTGVVLGTNFVGCIEQVTGVLLESASDWNNVEWGVCPLEMQQGCQPPVRDPCYTHPCKNHGVCSSDAQAASGFTCKCTARYEGDLCETDTGPLCNQPEYSLDCQNGGFCEEDDIGNSTFCQCQFPFEGPLCNDTAAFICEEDTCLNNATCKPTDTGVECECQPGFSGDNCAININECAIHQCLNGGSCIDGINSYTCNCTGTGYTGQLCTDPVNECDAQPCQNGGTCLDTSGSFVCLCPSGWTGLMCELEEDECMSNPCDNGGTCTDLFDAFQCQCVQGFSGDQCKTNIDDCISVTCPPTFDCIDGIDSYTCECPPGKVNESGTCQDYDECLTDPCVNGDCVNLDNMYRCDCYPGFNGTNCEINIDECEPEPCLMNSTCVDLIDGFNCTCLPGYGGDLCDVDIDECLMDLCQNGATCVDRINSFTCDCAPGFDGDYCDNDIDDCAISPCQNGATCVDEVNDYTCNCILGFDDKNCSTNIDDCQPDPCSNNATCIDLVNDFSCNCSIDYMGETCDEYYDACVALEPCQNGATCTTPPLPSQEYTCQCVFGYNGTDCEINIDDCLGVDCAVEGGTGQICFDEVGDYRCACPIGFTDPDCTVDINECDPNPCMNNATCNDFIGFYNCSCAPGFAGVNCEENINECDPNPCQNDGLCVDEDNGYQCYCLPGHTGDNCEVFVNECLPNPCLNDGICVDKVNDFSCNCVPGFTGDVCEINIDECLLGLCENNATCVDGINEFTCNCSLGFNGTYCEVDIDECAVNPCNTGICKDAINDFTCDCSNTGFFGPQCEYNIDDCALFPCDNNATCVDLIKDYNCSCWAGYEGKNCSDDIDECLDQPCLNGGACLERSSQDLYDGSNALLPGDFSYATASGFVCECAMGYEGEECEVDIDECISGPCANNGTCIDGVNGYTCDCAGGWEGVECTTEIDECLAVPCQNGATCTDLINDYMCTCTEEYGGTNCTVELTGCDGNDCRNGATCVPSYDEVTDSHSFSCECDAGYSGDKCETVTSVAFEGDSYLRDPSTNDASTLDFSLAIQTTLPDGVLLYSGESTAYFLLEMFNGDLFLTYMYSDGSAKTINDFGQPVNDGEYHTVKVIVTDSAITLSVTINESTRSRRTATCTGGVCQQEIPITIPVSFDAMYVGGVPDVLQAQVQDRFRSGRFFTGCMQDIMNGKVYVLPEEVQARAAPAPSGCIRVNQCPDDRCNYQGGCTDLWLSFTCDCDIGYAGLTCNESFVEGTFRFEDTPMSFAEFTADDTLSGASSSISLAFRTREPDGLIFFTQDTNTNSYITIEMINNNLTVAVSQNLNTVSKVVGTGLSDGVYHSLSVLAEESQLQVTLDGSDLQPELLSSGTPEPDYTTFMVGGVADFSAVSPGDAISSDAYFKGCLWDVKYNNYSLQFEPLDIPDFPIPSFPMTTNNSVLINGCESDDACADSPCDNGGTCRVTWNDFECDCPTGFGGKNCSDLTICSSADTCPEGAECRDLPDGHECVVEGTFNGVNSLITYTADVSAMTDLNSITLRARTRSDAGIIYHSSNSMLGYFVSMFLNQSKPTIRFNLGEYAELQSQVAINDGEWHDIEVQFSDTQVDISIDGGLAVTGTYSFLAPLANVTTSPGSSLIFLGGTTTVNSDYFMNYNYFKGCLDDIRVGGILLPFFDRETINSTSLEQFEANINNVESGCKGDPTVCNTYTCLNSGTCVDVWNAADCECVPGYTGDNCEEDIDECLLYDTCALGSTCRDDINNYTCLCQPGYEGRNCDVETNECDPNPCLEGSVCYDGLDFFNCTCLDGYTGALCDVLVNETCLGDPCKNGGTCTDSSAGSEVQFECQCPTGFDGDDCGREIDYCLAHQCANGATCISDRDNEDYRCDCPDGYSGNRCETNDDNCIGVVCQNGGNCVDEINGYTCNCTGGYEGPFCGTDINECDPDPCQFGATCNDLLNDFNCVCMPGFSGRFCSIDIDECLNSVNPPCQNGGNCTNTVGSFACSCPPNTYGPRCQITPCDPSPCENNSTCTTLSPGGYNCLCPLGYEGATCSLASCSSVVCENGGSCQLGGGSWKCICAEFVTGSTCQYKGPCAPDIDPCINSGTCQQTFIDGGSFTYMCDCPIGFNGTNCENEINWCDSNPCQHEGSNCTSTRESFICDCGPGYNGTFCEIKLPDCNSSLCQNGASCEDLDYGYECHCADGFTGSDCEIEIDECRDEPCQNNGICSDAINGFECNCTGTGYEGSTCSTDVDECNVTAPCENDGVCNNLPGSFQCECKGGWLPPTCSLMNPCVSEKPCQNGGTCDYSVSQDGKAVEYVCKCGKDYAGNKCERFTGSQTNWALIGGVTGGAIVLLIIVIVLGIFLVNVKNKRATRGTYSPSRQEISGSRVEMDNILKLPPEERLI